MSYLRDIENRQVVDSKDWDGWTREIDERD